MLKFISTPDHSLVIVDPESEENVLDSAARRERRKKLIDDLKKKEPSKSLFVKLLKTIFYVFVMGLFIFALRTLLNILNLLPYEDNTPVCIKENGDSKLTNKDVTCSSYVDKGDLKSK